MATATAVFTPFAYNPQVSIGKTRDRNFEIVHGTLAIQASPATYLTNGLPITFLAGTEIHSLATKPQLGFLNGVAGYEYKYDTVHGTVRIYQSAGSAAPNAEIATGTAIAAAISGDTITGELTFPAE